MRVVHDDAPGPITTLAYSPDGSALAAAGPDGHARLWCPLTGRLLATCRCPISWGSGASVSFSPDGSSLAVGTFDAALYDARTGEVRLRIPLADLPATQPRPPLVAFRDDGQRLAVAHGAEVTEHQPATGLLLRTLRTSYAFTLGPFTAVSYGPEHEVMAGGHNQVFFWPKGTTQPRSLSINWPEGEVVALHAFGDPTRSDDAHLLVARGRAVALWRLDHDAWKRRQELRHPEVVRAVALSVDGRTLLTGGGDWTVRVFGGGGGGAAAWQKRDEFNWRVGPVTALAIAPDGMTAAVAGRDRPGALIWDLE